MPRDDRGTDERRLTRPPAARLDIPRELRRTIVRRRAYDADAFGRLSERIARFLGTGQFLVYMTATIVLWVLWNIFAPEHLRWDQYPFIFLTLALSLQASYAAPLILLAQNRQEDRDRAQGERDRDRSARVQAESTERNGHNLVSRRKDQRCQRNWEYPESVSWRSK